MQSPFLSLILFSIVHVSFWRGVGTDLTSDTTNYRTKREALQATVTGLQATAGLDPVSNYERALASRNTALLEKLGPLKTAAIELGKKQGAFETHQARLDKYDGDIDDLNGEEQKLVNTHNGKLNEFRATQLIYSKLAHVEHAGKFSEFLRSKLDALPDRCVPGTTPTFSDEFTDSSISKDEINEIFKFLKSIEPSVPDTKLMNDLVKEGFRHAQLDPNTCLIKSVKDSDVIQRKAAFLYLDKIAPTAAITMVRQIACKLRGAVPALGELTIDEEVVKVVKNVAEDYTKEGRFTFAVEQYDSIVSNIFSKVIQEKMIVEKKAKDGYVYSEAQIRCLVEKRVSERLGEVNASPKMSPNSIFGLISAATCALVATLIAIKKFLSKRKARL